MNRKVFDKMIRDFSTLLIFGNSDTIFTDTLQFTKELWEYVNSFDKDFTEHLEKTLTSKYENDTYTWHQIKDAIKSYNNGY